MLRADNLNIWFGDSDARFQAVTEVCFSVPRGQCVGLVGESGSGKTTILKAFAGLIQDWSGSMHIGGEDLATARPQNLRRRMQLIFQDPYASLHPRHTVDRVLSETAQLHNLPEANRRIEKGLADVGLGKEFRFRYPHQLSGGQRQRVALARALIVEPEILLLDEPTSALDVSVQAEILNLLSELRQKRGLTYLLVSHDLAVISHMCGQLVIMAAGRIVEIMEVAELRAGRATQEYTRRLLQASRGYDRVIADDFIDREENI